MESRVNSGADAAGAAVDPTVGRNGRAKRLGPIVAGAGRRSAGERVVARLLRVPLFYKILLANAALVVVVAIGGPTLAARLVRAWPGLVTAEVAGAIALAGVAISIILNAVILRVALSPLRALERAAERVQCGDVEARAALSPLADRDLARLIITFNGVLETTAGYRRRLREIAARALNAAEEERRRIARELHDGTAQTLAALRVRLRLARAAREDADRDAILEEVSDEIGAAMEEVRRIARGLRPPALDMLGLAPAIESHARSLAEATGIAVDVDVAPIAGLLSPEAELALYRVVQEALSNVVRHAEATRVRVRLRARPGLVEALVEDDGRGFSVRDAMSGGPSGLGLFGMQERASYVGGRVEITSEPGAGTRVLAMIPRSELEADA